MTMKGENERGGFRGAWLRATKLASEEEPLIGAGALFTNAPVGKGAPSSAGFNHCQDQHITSQAKTLNVTF